MSIRTKMIALLALLFVILILIEIAVQESVLLPSFAELERDDAKVSMKRISYALDMTLGELESSAADWGNWIDVYRFVHKPDQEFIDTNMTRVTMKELQLNALLIVDLGGRIVSSLTQDLETGKALNLDLASAKELPDDFPWRANLISGKPAKGLIQTNQGVMMMTESPIMDGTGTGDHRGMVIMGRLLTPHQVEKLGALAQAAFALIKDGRAHDEDAVIETKQSTQVYRPIRDVYGRPLLTLRIDVPRNITAHGQKVVTYASAYLVLAAVIALILLLTIVNRLVLRPLARVTRHAVAIGNGTDLSARLNLPGKDEISRLASEFDRMVARLAETRRELVDQSFRAGFAELAKGILHNLGNALTPSVVRLAKLSDRLRDAPARELEMACAQLSDSQSGAAAAPGGTTQGGDAQRRKELWEFMRLGCREMNTTVAEARSDVEVIQRQAIIVQTALVELMQSTRNESPIESVCLPELVTEMLEIVPDAYRQRLTVDADESLRRIGTVRVARTILGMVLQNLIINAADAVRDAGKEKGVLRVAAEIVREADREQLHLHCKDNGVGIPASNLERVFDHGFTTKSKDANYGIGLHWCANAISALGGRIWAASEGPGLGASMHLMLPLSVRES